MFVIRPRWRKVFRDLWENKTQTLLVVLTISVGVGAFGILSNARSTLDTNLKSQFLSITPASATLTMPPFTDDFVDSVEHMNGIAAAEGRRTVRLRLRLPDGTWAELNLIAVSNFERMSINRVF